MRSKTAADQEIERLLIVKRQIDATIESLNSHHVTVPDDYIHESTGNLLLGYTKDSEMTLLIYGRENYLICAEAMEQARRKQ